MRRCEGVSPQSRSSSSSRTLVPSAVAVHIPVLVHVPAHAHAHAHVWHLKHQASWGAKRAATEWNTRFHRPTKTHTYPGLPALPTENLPTHLVNISWVPLVEAPISFGNPAVGGPINLSSTFAMLSCCSIRMHVHTYRDNKNTRRCLLLVIRQCRSRSPLRPDNPFSQLHTGSLTYHVVGVVCYVHRSIT